MKPVPTLKARRDFQKISRKGQKWVTASFILQAFNKEGDTEKNPSVGYTVSKKVGKAVVRNKMKRRFREVFKNALQESLLRNYSYVIIARRGSEKTSFGDLNKELLWSLKHLHRLLG